MRCPFVAEYRQTVDNQTKRCETATLENVTTRSRTGRERRLDWVHKPRRKFGTERDRHGVVGCFSVLGGRRHCMDTNVTGWKEIGTAIGAILGTIAFVQNFLKPLSAHNKLLWEQLTERINDLDFENIGFGVYQARAIDDESMDRLRSLIRYIERDAFELRFKTVFRDGFRPRFRRIEDLYSEWRNLVQVPWWEHKDDQIIFNKDVFFETYRRTRLQADLDKASAEYPVHLERAYDLVKAMQEEFRTIGVMATRETYELLLPWRWTIWSSLYGKRSHLCRIVEQWWQRLIERWRRTRK